jgi:hypothetical protein
MVSAKIGRQPSLAGRPEPILRVLRNGWRARR